MLPDVDSSGRELVEATREALEVGIAACGPGMPLNGIGQAIAWVTGDEVYAHPCSANLPGKMVFQSTSNSRDTVLVDDSINHRGSFIIVCIFIRITVDLLR